MPVDRFSFNFNFFDYVNQSVNQRLGVALNRIEAYRYTFGLEKTFLNQYASVGIRMPLNNATADSPVANLGNTSTAVGDLTVYFKYALWMDRPRGRVVSTGMCVTMPTGPHAFAGAPWMPGIHYTDLQPWIGFQWTWDRVFLIGFTAIDVPTSSRDATVYFNDLALGYFIYRSVNPRSYIQSVAPAFEAHSNTPLNHNDVFNFHDLAGTTQILDLTYGVNFFTRNRSIISLGLCTPVTGPRPYSLEALLLYNKYF
jgi:hypothetical protein